MLALSIAGVHAAVGVIFFDFPYALSNIAKRRNGSCDVYSLSGRQLTALRKIVFMHKQRTTDRVTGKKL
jgi:hypothetical protein